MTYCAFLLSKRSASDRKQFPLKFATRLIDKDVDNVLQFLLQRLASENERSAKEYQREIHSPKARKKYRLDFGKRNTVSVNSSLFAIVQCNARVVAISNNEFREDNTKNRKISRVGKVSTPLAPRLQRGMCIEKNYEISFCKRQR